jgi:hypothetical protein
MNDRAPLERLEGEDAKRLPLFVYLASMLLAGILLATAGT